MAECPNPRHEKVEMKIDKGQLVCPTCGLRSRKINPGDKCRKCCVGTINMEDDGKLRCSSCRQVFPK